MRYVTSLERIARKEGIVEGKIEGKIEGEKRGRIQALGESILQILHFRFQTDPALLSLLKTRLLLLEDDTLFISLVNSALEVASFTDFLYRLPEPDSKPAETPEGTQSNEHNEY